MKTYSAVLLVAFAFLVCACGSSDPSSSNPSKPKPRDAAKTPPAPELGPSKLMLKRVAFPESKYSVLVPDLFPKLVEKNQITRERWICEKSPMTKGVKLTIVAQDQENQSTARSTLALYEDVIESKMRTHKGILYVAGRMERMIQVNVQKDGYVITVMFQFEQTADNKEFIDNIEADILHIVESVQKD